MDFNSDNQQISKQLSYYINGLIQNPHFSKPSMEPLKNFLISIQIGFVPKLAKIEDKVTSNPTFIQLCKTLNIPRKYAFLGLLAAALFSVSSYTRHLWSKRPRFVSDVFALAGPSAACVKLIYNESIQSMNYDLSDASNDSATTTVMTSPNSTKEVVANKEKYKHWIVYWMFYGAFHLMDNMVNARTQSILKKPLPEGVKRKSTNPFWYYWLCKILITYWAGYNDGNVILYQKVVVPCLRKYHELTTQKINIE